MEPNPATLGISLRQSVPGNRILAGQHVLRQRRTLIGKMHLLTDQVDRAVESGLAHRNDGGSSRLPCADDDNVSRLRRYRRRFRLMRLCDPGCRQIGINENIVALDPDRECLEVPGQWGAQCLAGANVERALMQRALDLAALDKPFGKQCERMRAYAMRGVNLVFKTKERERNPVELHTDHPALRNRMKGSCALPCHGRRLSTVSRPYARDRKTRF